MERTAYGKINLGLRVLGKRPDGYHEVDMILQSISLADTITFTPAPEFSLETDRPDLPCDDSNLMVKAARAFARATGRTIDYHLACTKRIFLAAGLAGGSTDAAAVLRGLNDLCGSPLDRAGLEQLGATIGSDVPFCVYGGTQRGRGRGEQMTVLPAAPLLWLVLVKPRELGVSTAWVYGEIDKATDREPVDLDGLEKALRQGDRKRLLALMGNDLELVTLKAHPELQALKEAIAAQGAEKVLMSGSGPTLFGIFTSREKARQAADRLRDRERDAQIKIAHTVQEE